MGNTDIANALRVKDLYHARLTSYVQSMQSRTRPDKLKEFSEMRGFSMETIQKLGIFYIGEMAEMLVPEYLEDIKNFGVISETNLKPIFRDRYVIPIKNVDGTVCNLVGYSKEANERYIYGTAKYYERRDTLWGLENLSLAYKLGYAILTEGITDAIRLRDIGYQNTFAMCGTQESTHIMRQLNRCRHGIIKIPDRDDAGLRALKHWNTNRSVTLKVALQYKDIDEMCSDQESNIDTGGNIEWVKEYLDECIGWILTDTHNGKQSIQEEITIL